MLERSCKIGFDPPRLVEVAILLRAFRCPVAKSDNFRPRMPNACIQSKLTLLKIEALRRVNHDTQHCTTNSEELTANNERIFIRVRMRIIVCPQGD